MAVLKFKCRRHWLFCTFTPTSVSYSRHVRKVLRVQGLRGKGGVLHAVDVWNSIISGARLRGRGVPGLWGFIIICVAV